MPHTTPPGGGTDTEIVYRIDAHDRIVAVNEAWNQFAVANDGAGLVESRIVGRSIWEYIGDPTTLDLYQQIVARVRAGVTFRYPFRCDAPQYRRHLEMRIVPAADPGGVEFRCRIQAVEDRPVPALLDASRGHTSGIIRACGWCKKFGDGDDWVEVEDAVRRLGIFEQMPVPKTSHGICPACYDTMVPELSEA